MFCVEQRITAYMLVLAVTQIHTVSIKSYSSSFIRAYYIFVQQQ